MRLWIKNLICWLGYGDRLIEYCQDCGIRQPIVWWASEKLWSKVAEDAHVLCPKCFSDRAAEKGYFVQWIPMAANLED